MWGMRRGVWGDCCTQNNTEDFLDRRTKDFRQKNIRTIRQKNISTKGKTSKCGVKTIDLDKIQELKHPNVG